MRTPPRHFMGDVHSLADVKQYICSRVEIKLVYKATIAYYFNSSENWNEAYWFPGLAPVIITGGRKDATPRTGREYITEPKPELEEAIRKWVENHINQPGRQIEEHCVSNLMDIIKRSGK